MFSNEELERYNRHLILPEIGVKGQEKLKKARVLVIGAGGLGCPVLLYLAASGVGTIGICDFDFIDSSNLQRQILYTVSDIGKPKAVVAAQKLEGINPYVDFIVHNLLLSKENVLEIFSNYDLIIDGTDNFPTRFLINDACVIMGKPYVFGAIYRFEGQVSVFNYQGGPSYRCIFPEEPNNNEGVSCAQIGVMGIVPGLIGCYQANEAIKIICGIGNVLNGKLLLIDLLNLSHQIIEISRSGKTIELKELGEYGDFCKEKYNDIKSLSPLKLFDLITEGKAIVIDIRIKEIFNQYHIQSENITLDELILNPDLITRDKMVILVCEFGINSLSIIDTLNKSNKFNNLYNLTGGIQAWIKAGLPYIVGK